MYVGAVSTILDLVCNRGRHCESCEPSSLEEATQKIVDWTVNGQVPEHLFQARLGEHIAICSKHEAHTAKIFPNRTAKATGIDVSQIQYIPVWWQQFQHSFDTR